MRIFFFANKERLIKNQRYLRRSIFIRFVKNMMMYFFLSEIINYILEYKEYFHIRI